MIDNLKEAIEHAKEVSENWKSQMVNCVSEEGRNKCLECAKEHEQLAAWLEELKERREADRWRKLNEEKPKVSGSYLVSGVWGSGKVQVGDCEFNVEDGYFDACWNFNILAWKPLPKFYESEAV